MGERPRFSPKSCKNQGWSDLGEQCPHCKYCIGHEIHKEKTQGDKWASSGAGGWWLAGGLYPHVSGRSVKAQQHWPEVAPPMVKAGLQSPALLAHSQLIPQLTCKSPELSSHPPPPPAASSGIRNLSGGRVDGSGHRGQSKQDIGCVCAGLETGSRSPHSGATVWWVSGFSISRSHTSRPLLCLGRPRPMAES